MHTHSHPSQHSPSLTPITTPTICTHTHHNTHYMHSHPSQHPLYALTPITTPTICTHTHHNTHYMHSHPSQHSPSQHPLYALSHITTPTTCTLTPITTYTHQSLGCSKSYYPFHQLLYLLKYSCSCHCAVR